jgi:hypothetical protein
MLLASVLLFALVPWLQVESPLHAHDMLCIQLLTVEHLTSRKVSSLLPACTGDGRPQLALPGVQKHLQLL